MADKKADINYLRYRYNYFMKRGQWEDAKKVSERAIALYGRNIDQEHHNKKEQEYDPKDPFGIGRTKKVKYG